jgi:hypothetical protein
VVVDAATRAAGATLAKAIGGEVSDGKRGGGGARLAITLGPPCPAGVERRVRLGSGGDADYAVAGEPAALAEALARAIEASAREDKPREDKPREDKPREDKK